MVAFLLRESERVSVGSAKGRVAELWSLLKFLFVRGLTPHLLTTAVPRSRDGARRAFPRRCPPATCSCCWTAVIAAIQSRLATTRF